MGIPKIIHRCWLGGKEPEWTRGFADGWRWPGWQLWEWDDRMVKRQLWPLKNQAAYNRANRIVPGQAGPLRADLVRYEILHKFGGMWVDTDFECLRPFPHVVENLDAFLLWEDEPYWVCNGLMGAVPRHIFIKRLIAGVPSSVERAMAGVSASAITGPRYVTSLWQHHGNGISLLPQESFLPFGWRDVGEFDPGNIDPHKRWPRAYAVHWWRHQRELRAAA